MGNERRYEHRMDIKCAPLERIDVPAIAAESAGDWFNQTLTRVNDSVVRLGVVRGVYHWHRHEEDDEFFFVLSGRLFIDLEDRTIELGPQQGVTIPKGTRHRPRAPERTVMLMVETASIDPLGSE
ncbi:MAG: cupin domain-containing protein [Acidobacteria bacterium]|nr:MAG: cupin domain-containing protein [Acidobacteriota bacterium]